MITLDHEEFGVFRLHASNILVDFCTVLCISLLGFIPLSIWFLLGSIVGVSLLGFLGLGLL